jgi:lipopolysaccharide export system protein LptA
MQQMKRDQMINLNRYLIVPMAAFALSTTVSLAQTVGGGVFAPGGHNADQPVEISSDSLEIEQEKELAVFEGNVDAVQGDLTLKTDRLEVHYKTENEGTDDENQAISTMEAKGNVHVTSPRETAQGDRADFNIAENTLILHDNVLLTQGRNVLCGKSLDMNLTTGRSLLKGACNKSSSNTKGRVQGVFFPSNSN